MKRILLFFTVILFAAALEQSCSPVKKSLTSVKEHKAEFIVLWLPPEGLDEKTMSDDNVNYMVEGNLLNGTPVLAFVKAKRVKEILKLPWTFPNDGYYHGYLFTCDDLGRKSILTKNEVNGSNYSDQQRELLKRHWDERKYDLFSQASKFPIRGKLDVAKKMIIPLRNESGELVFDGPGSTNNPVYKEKQGNSFFDGLGKQQ